MRAITRVKETRSLVRIKAVPARAAAVRTARPGWAARAAPTRAPRALEPVSPSMVSSMRSSGRAATAVPSTPAARILAASALGRRSASRGALRAAAAFRARPGRRSSKLRTFAQAATSTALVAASTAVAHGPRAPTALRWRARSTPETRAPEPMTAILMTPVVTRPRARAPRWPANPLAGAPPSWAPASMSSTRPAAPADIVATRAATATRLEPGADGPAAQLPTRAPAATAPTATPMPPRRLTVRPRKLVRSSRPRSLSKDLNPVDQDKVAPSAPRATPPGERSGAVVRAPTRPGARLSGFMNVTGSAYREDRDIPIPRTFHHLPARG